MSYGMWFEKEEKANAFISLLIQLKENEKEDPGRDKVYADAIDDVIDLVRFGS